MILPSQFDIIRLLSEVVKCYLQLHFQISCRAASLLDDDDILLYYFFTFIVTFARARTDEKKKIKVRKMFLLW